MLRVRSIASWFVDLKSMLSVVRLSANFKWLVFVLASLMAWDPLNAMAQETTPPEDPAAPKSAPQSFFLWQDNSISLLPYGKGFAVDAKQQSTATFEHADESRIGDMFMFVDWTDYHGSQGGDSSWYGEIGPRLSLGKMLGKDLSYQIFPNSLFEIKDVLIAAQYERGQDADVAEAALLGVGLNLDVREAGILGALGKFNYVQLNFYARAELTKNAPPGFRDMQVTMVASYPFEIGRAHFLIDGYFDWVLGIGSEDWSYHLNPQFTMDLGAFWNEPKKLYVGVEADWWWHKYQIPDSPVFNTNQQAFSLLLKYHF